MLSACCLLASLLVGGGRVSSLQLSMLAIWGSLVKRRAVSALDAYFKKYNFLIVQAVGMVCGGAH